MKYDPTCDACVRGDGVVKHTCSKVPMHLTDTELAEEARLARVRYEALRNEEKARTEVRKKAVKPVYEFTLLPADKAYDKVFDDSCRMYELSGKVVNKKEMKEAGALNGLLFEGGMRYIFNGATGKFVCGVGGGSIFLDTHLGWDVLSHYIRMTPEGGDVTVIVEAHRAVGK